MPRLKLVFEEVSVGILFLFAIGSNILFIFMGDFAPLVVVFPTSVVVFVGALRYKKLSVISVDECDIEGEKFRFSNIHTHEIIPLSDIKEIIIPKFQPIKPFGVYFRTIARRRVFIPKTIANYNEIVDKLVSLGNSGHQVHKNLKTIDIWPT